MTEPLSPPDPPDECEHCGAEQTKANDCRVYYDGWNRTEACYEREIEQLKEQNKALLKGPVVTGLVEALKVVTDDQLAAAKAGHVVLWSAYETPWIKKAIKALAAYDEAVKGAK